MDTLPDFIDYTHMTRAEAEIIRAQIAILTALKILMPAGMDFEHIEEIESTINDLYEFHHEGKYRDDGDDDIRYADTK